MAAQGGEITGRGPDGGIPVRLSDGHVTCGRCGDGIDGGEVEQLQWMTDHRCPAGEFTCPCGDPEWCLDLMLGQPWCRPCGQHHRPPECPVNEAGESLAPCGHTWKSTAAPDHFTWCNPDES